MPELPEVETVRRGLAPWVEGARIDSVTLNRADLRFPFPPDLREALEGATITALHRRAKYLLFRLSTGRTWLSHLGMTGSWRVATQPEAPQTRYYPAPQGARHDHVVIGLTHPLHGAQLLVYTDARRFGFIDLLEGDETSPYLSGLGPEPLGNQFSADMLAARFKGRRGPVKAALLDQAVVAGIGNIYASEALYRAHIRPDVAAGALVLKSGGAGRCIEDLVSGVRAVLDEAILAGGSTLRDFRNAEGQGGYFQHSFSVYDREGLPCPTPGCGGVVQRIVQSGRSSFFCPRCQRG